MFLKTIYLFLLLWIFNAFRIFPCCTNSAYVSTHHQHGLINGSFLKSVRQAQVGIHNDLRHIKNSGNKRPKRGIILVDEDFDVPAKPGVKHGWGENEEDSEDNVFETLKEKENFNFVTDEGSGVGEVTRDSGYTQSMLPVKQTKTEKLLPTSKSTSTTPLVIPTELEGSGDESTSSPKILEPTKQLPVELIPELCLNSTCGLDELSVISSYEGFVPEGENLTLLCSANQSVYESHYTTLLWYRSNGSMHLLQAFDRHHELRFEMPEVKVIHSGVYLCVKWENTQSCCHRNLFISVYEVPGYQYHLIIIGFITAACLVTCIFLAIWRSIALKKYTKQFAKIQSNQKPLLI